MNWKTILTGAIITVIGLVIYSYVKPYLPVNELETGYLDFDQEADGYTVKNAA